MNKDELLQMIENMKCCGNCKYNNIKFVNKGCNGNCVIVNGNKFYDDWNLKESDING